MQTPPKHPSTPHWPWSEKVHRDDSYHQNPEHFLNRQVVVTEKIDGGNTALHCGQVFARSVLAPAGDGWFAMVKKHHAWKVDPEARFLTLYGEDIYGIHTLEYDPVFEDETFYLFAARLNDGEFDHFSSWAGVVQYAKAYKLRHVPVVFEGEFKSTKEITEFFTEMRKLPSSLGGEREGFVLRVAESFNAENFSLNVCKFVRANHVQTSSHWRQNWQPCSIIGRS